MPKTGTGLSVRSKVWFVVDESHVFGSGLASLLENIDQAGTLSRAAQRSGMSYRYAWKLIKKAETHVGTRLTVPHPGGAGGGRSELSPEGRRLLSAFRRISREVASYTESRFKQLDFSVIQNRSTAR